MIHTSDDVFVAAPPRAVQEAILHLHEDASWWPGCRARGGYGWLEVDAPAGPSRERVRFKVRIEDAREWEGFRWVFESGPLEGAAEFWLEGYRNGTIVHYLTALTRPASTAAGDVTRHRWAMRAGLNALKDRFERVPSR